MIAFFRRNRIRFAFLIVVVAALFVTNQYRAVSEREHDLTRQVGGLVVQVRSSQHDGCERTNDRTIIDNEKFKSLYKVALAAAKGSDAPTQAIMGQKDAFKGAPLTNCDKAYPEFSKSPGR